MKVSFVKDIFLVLATLLGIAMLLVGLNVLLLRLGLSSEQAHNIVEIVIYTSLSLEVLIGAPGVLRGLGWDPKRSYLFSISLALYFLLIFVSRLWIRNEGIDLILMVLLLTGWGIVVGYIMPKKK